MTKYNFDTPGSLAQEALKAELHYLCCLDTAYVQQLHTVLHAGYLHGTEAYLYYDDEMKTDCGCAYAWKAHFDGDVYGTLVVRTQRALRERFPDYFSEGRWTPLELLLQDTLPGMTCADTHNLQVIHDLLLPYLPTKERETCQK